jgi:DUF4097 and DUF4098 domain-containing protein YvlB
MSEGDRTVPLTAPPQLRVVATSGSITVIAESRADVDSSGARITPDDDGGWKITGRKSSQSMTIRCPEGSDVMVGTRSGRVTLKGRLGDVRVQTASGHIEVDRVRSADIRSMSASIEVSACETTCRIKTKSGSARIDTTGEADVAVGSGSIVIKTAHGSVRARAISGLIEIGAGGTDRVLAETMSGSITITVPSSCHPRVKAKSLSQRPDVSVTRGDDCEIVAKTLSGGIRVRPA